MVLALLGGVTAYCVAEEITLTTYYPSPRGVYEGLRVTGTVGIGTMDPQANLDVNGNMRIADGTQGQDRVLTSNENGLASWQPPQGVPAGGVMFFNLPTCPSGWSEVGAAQGRVIVGLPSGGTLGGTANAALGNLENRTHTHPYSDVIAHAHAVNDPGHTHTNPSRGEQNANLAGENIITTNHFVSNYTILANTTGITINSTGVATGTTQGTSATMPYIQFKVCQKN